jgi:two-component system sensor histidine kinase HydH
MHQPPEAQKHDEHLVMLGQLASALSHEIRNPLGTVFLLVDMLEEELQQPTNGSRLRMTEALTDIKTELVRMNDLVQNYLSLARLAELRCEPADLCTVVKGYILEIHEQLAHRGIRLHLDGLTSLGQVPLHQNTFRRVLINLIQNAIDAMSQGGTLTLRGQQDDSCVRLEVQDTGTGIVEEQLPMLFTPFHTTKPEGTGLGLYVVQQIVAAHGGTVTVTSTPGRGTTCVVTLPLAAT